MPITKEQSVWLRYNNWILRKRSEKAKTKSNRGKNNDDDRRRKWYTLINRIYLLNRRPLFFQDKQRGKQRLKLFRARGIRVKRWDKQTSLQRTMKRMVSD